MILDLKRIYHILEIIVEKMWNLEEEYDYVTNSPLGINSGYSSCSFEYFLEIYNFRVDKDNIVVFDDSYVPYEDFTVNNYNYLPKNLLNLSDEEIRTWTLNEYKSIVENNKNEIVKEMERKKCEIERLTKELEELEKHK